MSHSRIQRPVGLSIGILAGNDATAIPSMLGSLFRQSVFEHLAARHQQCEILVLAHGCTDGTADVARGIFSQAQREHPWARAWRARVIELAEPGRNTAWNRFVHEFSALDARYLTSIQADILLHHRDALFSLVWALERRLHVNAASGRRCEDIVFKERKTFRERLALAALPADGNNGGELNGELVCLRADVARRMHLPPGLGSGFDHFVTRVVGTDFFSGNFDPTRLALPPSAAHICTTPVRARDVLESRKRRLIGQTAARVLLDYLRSRTAAERRRPVDMLRSHENLDARWLEKLVAAHVRRRSYLTPLFSGVLRMRRNTAGGWARVCQLPEAATGFVLTVIASLRAHRWLRSRRGTPETAPASEILLSNSRREKQ